MDPVDSKPDWFTRLWAKKVPQYLGTYLAVGFGLLQFIEFVVRRYELNENLVDKYLILWLLALPAVSILIYYGGQLPQGKRGVSWQKATVYGNLAVAGILSLLLFNGPAQEQEAPKLVEVQNQEGKTISTLVPSLNQVKKLAVFLFKNESNNPGEAWWGTAFTHLLQATLRQHPEFYPVSEYSLHTYTEKLGLEQFSDLNVGLQRQVAQESRNDYFTRLEYEIEEGIYTFSGGFYRTKDGKELFKLQTQNTDPFVAIDDLGEQIVAQIPNPMPSVEGQSKLPVSAIITDNIEALKNLTLSRLTFYDDPSDLEPVVELARKAVAADPNCSVCHYYLGDPLYGMGKREEAMEEIGKAVRYGTAMPEREQFTAKAVLYSLRGDYQASIQLQENLRKMFPFDYSSYSVLVDHYKSNYGVDSAKALIQEALENGHRESGLLELYELQLEEEEFAEAEKTLDQFVEAFPEREQDKIRYATLYEKQGRLEDTRRVLEEQRTMDPFNVDILLRLAALDFRQLDFAAAKQKMAQALSESASLQDSLRSQYAIASDFLNRGQTKAALEAYDTYEVWRLKMFPRSRVIPESFNWKLYTYGYTDQYEKLDQLIDDIVYFSPERRGYYACYKLSFHFIYQFGQQELDQDQYLPCAAIYNGYGGAWSKYHELTLAMMNKDYSAAVDLMQENQEININMIPYKFIQAKIYRLAGDPDAGIKVLQAEIDAKGASFDAYLEMAYLQKDRNPTLAKELLARVLTILAQADDNFVPAQRAQELATELGMS